MKDPSDWFTCILVILCLESFFLIESANSKPYIYLFIPVEPYSQARVLPFALSGIEAQDYPKNRINIHILFGFHQDPNIPDDSKKQYVQRNRITFNQIQAWAESNKKSYRDIHLEITPLEWVSEKAETSQENWLKSQKYANLSESMLGALKKAKAHEVEYIFFMDPNIILVNGSALSALVETKCPKLAENPSPFDQVKLEDGSVPELTTSERKSGEIDATIDLGQFCILSDSKLMVKNGLIANDSGTLNDTLDSLKGFVQPLEDNGTLVYSSDDFDWGYLLRRVDGEGLEEVDLDLIDLELVASIKGLMFPESESMKPFVLRPKKDKLGVDQIYIINLAKRSDRREEMNKRMEILGIEAEFWNAVDGEDLKQNASLLEGLHVINGLIENITPMNWGIVACFLSHYNVWLNAVENDLKSIIVFEDDVIFARNFKHEWNRRLVSLESYKALHGSFDFVYLGRRMMRPFEDRPTEFPGLVTPAYSFRLHAYLIRRTGIEKVIASQPLDKMIPVDVLITLLADQIHPSQFKSEKIDSLFPNRTLKALSVEPLLVNPCYKQIPGGFSNIQFAEKIKSGEVLRKL